MITISFSHLTLICLTVIIVRAMNSWAPWFGLLIEDEGKFESTEINRERVSIFAFKLKIISFTRKQK